MKHEKNNVRKESSHAFRTHLRSKRKCGGKIGPNTQLQWRYPSMILEDPRVTLGSMARKGTMIALSCGVPKMWSKHVKPKGGALMML